MAKSAPIYSCDYTGAVSVSINGAPFARTWWSMAGDTVTEFTPAAKAQLGHLGHALRRRLRRLAGCPAAAAACRPSY